MNGNGGPDLKYILEQAQGALHQGASVADVNASIKSASGGKAVDYADLYQQVNGKPLGPASAPGFGQHPSVGGLLSDALGYLKSAGAGLAEGVTLGHAGQVAAAARTAFGPDESTDYRTPRVPKPVAPSEQKQLATETTQADKALAGAKKLHPVVAGVAEAAGATVPFGLLAMGMPEAVGPVGAATISGGVTGAAAGENLTPGQRAVHGLESAGGAAVLSFAGKNLESVLFSDQALNEALAKKYAETALPGIGRSVEGQYLQPPIFEDGQVKVEPFYRSLKESRQRVGRAVYEPIDKAHPNGVPDPEIQSYLSGKDASPQQQRIRLNAVKHVMGDEAGKRSPTPGELRDIRAYLRGEGTRIGGSTENPGNQHDAIQYDNAADGLDKLMKSNIPGQAGADLQYRVAKLREDAPKAARKAWGEGSKLNRPEQIEQARAKATTYIDLKGVPHVDPVADAAFRSEIVAEQVDRFGQKGGAEITRSQWHKLTAPVGEARLRAGLYPDGPEGDADFARLKSSIKKGKRIYFTRKQRRYLKYMLVRPVIFGSVFGGVEHLSHGGAGAEGP